MFLKALKGILYMALGVILVYFFKDPIIASLVGLVVVIIVEIIKQKALNK